MEYLCVRVICAITNWYSEYRKKGMTGAATAVAVEATRCRDCYTLYELYIHSKRCFIDFYVLFELLSVCNVTMCESDDVIVLRWNRVLRRISMFWMWYWYIHRLHCVLCTRSGTSNEKNNNNVCTLSCTSRWRVLAISSNSMWRAFDFRRRQSHAFAFHVYVRRNLCVYLLIGLSIAAKNNKRYKSTF